ncbi:EamA family transporter [Candidatus Bathyarchaeota archaeon]|nr:EamA family transporter [Candidatus Bathyarchaeota archaeon]
MEPLPFLLVVVSALFHALWNLLAKGGSDKGAFMWWMTFTSLFTVLPIYYLQISDWSLPFEAIPLMLASGSAEALYFISLGKAYELGDLSVVYPLARSSPLFLFLLALVFLGEEISIWGAIGILLVLLGVYMIHLRGLSSRAFLHPISSIRSRASQFALMAALSTSIYSLIDKVGVMIVGPFLYSFWLDLFIIALLTPMVLWNGGLGILVSEWRSRGPRIIFSGFLMRVGYLLVLVAMGMAQVSYILSVRQLSIVIGAALGVGLLGEEHGWVRLIASMIIFSGIFILGLIA